MCCQQIQHKGLKKPILTKQASNTLNKRSTPHFHKVWYNPGEGEEDHLKK